MGLRKTYPVNQLRDYSTLFMRSEITRILNKDYSSISKKAQRYDENLVGKGVNYLRYYRYIYKVLGKNYPNEYIYKNEFINQWLRNELGSTNSVIFSEFRIGKAVADLAMFNGTSKVFEIKTALDKESRLSGQIEEYKKIFNEIYVIIPSTCLEKYITFEKNIGIISFDSANGSFRMERKANINPVPDKRAIMEVLYTAEYKNIVESYYGFLPKMTDFTQFEICYRYISRIPADMLNDLFVSTIKKRDINNLFFNKKNSELNQVCLSLNLNKQQRDRLLCNLQNTTLNV